jgi:carbon monoxide dehydrogenase subunit G
MRFEGSLTVPADRQRVWDAIWDVPTMASWVPGCTHAERLPGDEERYRVRIEEKIGLIKAAFDLVIHVVDSTPLERIVVEGRGEDSRMASRISARSEVWLETAGEETRISYRHDVDIFGKLGALGFPIISRKAKEAEAEFARRARATLGAA